MRIRKRRLPFSLSSALSSDPQFNRSPVVQLPPLNNPHGNPLLSDRPNPPIGDPATASDSSNKKDRDCLELKQGNPAAAAAVIERVEEERGEVGRRSNDTRKKSIPGAEISIGSGSSHHQVGERWYEEEKVFPLKKRRGSFERRVEDEMILEKDKKGNTKMKTKMNKKCGQQKENEQEEIKEVDSITTAGAKKRSRGGALMEGSRCSRVNGRGWRCCQQTLVGYSLCEHHLGKGRLRSMTSVRSRSLASTNSTTGAPPKKDNPMPSPSSLSLQDNKHVILLDDDDNENGNTEEEEKKTKKKTKLGTVKARSISSLLGQTNDGFACVLDENK